jgi:DNA-directed RNA polymerase alpha subunit
MNVLKNSQHHISEGGYMTNLELVNFNKAYDILRSMQDKVEGLEEICEQLAVLTDIEGEYLLHQEPQNYKVEILFPISQQRLINSLLAIGIKTSNDLIFKTEVELLQMPNIGRLAVARIKDALQSKGLELKH